jgi:hypothetical protein
MSNQPTATMSKGSTDRATAIRQYRWTLRELRKYHQNPSETTKLEATAHQLRAQYNL